MNEPAYHLRPNKAVERGLFLELLSKLNPHLPQGLNNYRYVGMGGPYLDDFRAIHEAFPGIKMISLEVNRFTLARQRMNQPHRSIKLTRHSTDRFLRDFSSSDRHLAWFDYTKCDWAKQFEEVGSLLTKLRNGSVLKVTLIPVIKHLCASDKPDDRLKELKRKYEDFGPFELQDALRENFPRTLYRMFSKSVAQAVPDTAFRAVRPLASYTYADSSPVLTITLIVARPQEIEEMVAAAGLGDWTFSDLDWSGPKHICVPALSVRERISIDRWLPGSTSSGIVRRLRLQLAPSRVETVRIVDSYLAYSRYMPQFMRVDY